MEAEGDRKGEGLLLLVHGYPVPYLPRCLGLLVPRSKKQAALRN